MDQKLLMAIHDLMHTAECAADVLSNYADLESDGYGGMTPSRAAAYRQYLTESIEDLAKLIRETQ